MNIGRIPPLGSRAHHLAADSHVATRARSLPRRVVLTRPVPGVRARRHATPRGHGVLLHDRWTTQVLCTVWSVLHSLRSRPAKT